jgi:hypothetical protein
MTAQRDTANESHCGTVRYDLHSVCLITAFSRKSSRKLLGISLRGPFTSFHLGSRSCIDARGARRTGRVARPRYYRALPATRAWAAGVRVYERLAFSFRLNPSALIIPE